jgi:hypothetical protein
VDIAWIRAAQKHGVMRLIDPGYADTMQRIPRMGRG